MESSRYSSEEAESNKLEYQAAHEDMVPGQTFLSVDLGACEHGNSSILIEEGKNIEANKHLVDGAETPNALASVELVRRSLPKSM